MDSFIIFIGCIGTNKYRYLEDGWELHTRRMDSNDQPINTFNWFGESYTTTALLSLNYVCSLYKVDEIK